MSLRLPTAWRRSHRGSRRQQGCPRLIRGIRAGGVRLAAHGERSSRIRLSRSAVVSSRVLRQLTVTFSPSTAHNRRQPCERLSDGQQVTAFYISLVLAWQALARRVLSGREDAGSTPIASGLPVHTVIALEEPEISLAPQYLGRIIRQSCAGPVERWARPRIATYAPTSCRAPRWVRS